MNSRYSRRRFLEIAGLGASGLVALKSGLLGSTEAFASAQNPQLLLFAYFSGGLEQGRAQPRGRSRGVQRRLARVRQPDSRQQLGRPAQRAPATRALARLGDRLGGERLRDDQRFVRGALVRRSRPRLALSRQ